MSRRRQQGDQSAALHELCVCLASRNTFSPEEIEQRIAAFSTAELSSAHPLPLYHAAALGGRVQAVRVLLARGLPISLADQAVTVDRLVGGLFSSSIECTYALAKGSTALSLAAQQGHSTVVGVLLAAGADPSAGSLPPLAGAARCAPSVPGGRAKKMAGLVRQLLTAGADATAPAVLRAPLAMADAGCADAACMLLCEIYAHSRAGLLSAPTSRPAVDARTRGLKALLSAAAALDDVTAFCHFAAALLQLTHAWPAEGTPYVLRPVAKKLLETALEAGSSGVLRLAQRAAAEAAGSAGAQAPVASSQLAGMAAADAAVQRAMRYVQPAEAAAVQQLFSTGVDQWLAEFLRQAAYAARTAHVQVLLSVGQQTTLAAVCAAAGGGNQGALCLLLAAGQPEVPEGCVAMTPYSGRATLYMCGMSHAAFTCPLLALLQQRLHRDGAYGCRPALFDPHRPSRADLALLPLAEALVAAGYRPAVYHDVEVWTGF